MLDVHFPTTAGLLITSAIAQAKDERGLFDFAPLDAAAAHCRHGRSSLGGLTVPGKDIGKE
jgi:hypothetical protein